MFFRMTGAILLLAVLVGAGGPPHQAAATSGDLRVLPGLTRPGRIVRISVPFDGVLQTVQVKEGQTVEAGDVLGRMDDRVALASVAAARTAAEAHAQIDHAKLELELAEFTLQRMTETRDNSAATAKEYEEARIRRDQAEASVGIAEEAHEQAKARLAQEAARLETFSIRTPFAGSVVRVSAEAGETVGSSTEVFTVVNLDTLRAELNLPAELFRGMQTGESYELIGTVPAPHGLQGTLVSFEPIIDTATQTFRCVFEIDNRERRLPAGFKVTLAETSRARIWTRAADVDARLAAEVGSD